MANPSLPGPLTRAEGLEIIRSTCSREDTRTLEAAPEGRALLAGLVDIFVELSKKLDRSITARHLVARVSDVNPTAAGATAATATVQISRPASKVGVAFTLPKRSRACIVKTSDGHRYTLDADLVVAQGFAGPLNAAVTAKVPGYASTVIAGRINGFALVANGASGDIATVIGSGATVTLKRGAGDRFLQDFVGLYVQFTAGTNIGLYGRITAVLSDDQVTITSASPTLLAAETATATWVIRDWSELGFTVAQSADSTQGTDDDLDALLREVNRQRQIGETDASLLNARISLAAMISPNAIISLANRVLGVYGPVTLYETGVSSVECDPSIGMSPFPGYVAGLSPCGVQPDKMVTTNTSATATRLEAPPAGLMCTARDTCFFILRWDPVGLGDPGGYATGTSVGAPVFDVSPPHRMAAGVSACGGSPSTDNAIRSAIQVAITRIKAAGVKFRWYPKSWR